MHPHDRIRRNLDLVAERAPDLTARFYERLFESYPEVEPLFGRNSSAAQQEMLLSAIVSVVDHLDDGFGSPTPSARSAPTTPPGA